MAKNNLEPQTPEEWNQYIEGLKAVELHMNAQYPQYSESNSWAFSIARLEASIAYLKWVQRTIKH